MMLSPDNRSGLRQLRDVGAMTVIGGENAKARYGELVRQGLATAERIKDGRWLVRIVREPRASGS